MCIIDGFVETKLHFTGNSPFEPIHFKSEIRESSSVKWDKISNPLPQFASFAQCNNNAACLDDEESSVSEYVLTFRCLRGSLDSYEPTVVSHRKKERSQFNRPTKHISDRSNQERLNTLNNAVQLVQTKSGGLRTIRSATASPVKDAIGLKTSFQTSYLLVRSEERLNAPGVSNLGITPNERNFKRSASFNINHSRCYNTSDWDSEKLEMNANRLAFKPQNLCDVEERYQQQQQAFPLDTRKPTEHIKSSNVVKLLDRLKGVEFCGTQPPTRQLLWPIPKSCSEPIDEVQQPVITPKVKCSLAYEFRSICLHQQAVPRNCTWIVRRVDMTTNTLDFSDAEDHSLDCGDPKIQSPLLKVESNVDLTEHLAQSEKKLHSTGSASCLHTTSGLCTNRYDPAVHNESAASDVISSFSVNPSKAKRRVKITFRHCPEPSGSEATSLLVRLRISPKSVDDSTIMSAVDNDAKIEDTNCIPWMKAENGLHQPCFCGPTNCISSLDGHLEQYWEENDVINGMAECLITSLSSLSIPDSEVESMDSSISWNLPEPQLQRQLSYSQLDQETDTVIVEVVSDDEYTSKYPHVETSGDLQHIEMGSIEKASTCGLNNEDRRSELPARNMVCLENAEVGTPSLDVTISRQIDKSIATESIRNDPPMPQEQGEKIRSIEQSTDHSSQKMESTCSVRSKYDQGQQAIETKETGRKSGARHPVGNCEQPVLKHGKQPADRRNTNLEHGDFDSYTKPIRKCGKLFQRGKLPKTRAEKKPGIFERESSEQFSSFSLIPNTHSELSLISRYVPSQTTRVRGLFHKTRSRVKAGELTIFEMEKLQNPSTDKRRTKLSAIRPALKKRVSSAKDETISECPLKHVKFSQCVPSESHPRSVDDPDSGVDRARRRLGLLCINPVRPTPERVRYTNQHRWLH